MLRAHRPLAVRIWLLFLGAVLSSAIVLALGASADPSRAAAASLPASGVSVPTAKPVSKPKPGHRKSSSARRAKCAAAARTKKARKACPSKKSKPKASKPSVARKWPALAPALLSEPGDGDAPAEGPDSGPDSSPEAPGDAGAFPAVTPPVVETPPVETPPVETPPVETPPAEKSSTTTTLASSANPSSVGQAVTYTATIGPATATGTVEFKDGGVAIAGCGAQAVSSGNATCTTSGYTAAGSHSITAAYSGDGDYLASSSSALTQEVGKAPVTTAVSSETTPSDVGQPVTYTATLSALAATGTVTFEEEGAPIIGCAAQNVGFGTATCSVSGYPSAGSHSITATYSGDGNYTGSTSPVFEQVVSQASTSTTTTLSSSANPSSVGQAVTYTASVSPASATGTIEFRAEGSPITGCTRRTVSSGNTKCTVSGYAAAGSYSITAVYSGNGDYLASSSSVLTQEVGKAPVTAAVSSETTPSAVGQPVTYTATLSALAATGTVTFEEEGAPITGCAAQNVGFGAATCGVTGYPSTGSHSIVATYSGDENYLQSASPALTQTVKKAATTTTIASSVNPSMTWQPVTYTATVSPAAATGTVTFDEAGKPIAGCTAQTISSGTATCTLPAYAVAGTHTITATYSGDGNYLASASSSLRQVAYKPGTTVTTTTFSSSLNPSTVGQAVTYTATVSPAAATGTITFKEIKESGIAIPGCIKLTVTPGTMTCTTTYSTAGWHQIIAVYSGDKTYATSTSPALTQVVNGAPTTTTLSSSLNPSTVGQAVTYTATVSPVTATGTVGFTSNGNAITGCAAQAISSGRATCTVAFSAAGGPWIRAVYSGDSTYATSTFSYLAQTVNKKASTTTMSSSLNPSVVGEAVTYTATVSPAAATGTITFKEIKESGIAIPGCIKLTVTPGTMTCTTTYSTAGWHQIIAVYSGDKTYATSTSPALTQVVNGAPTTTTLSSSLNPSTVGQAVTYTATVSPATATGTVGFKEEGTSITGCTAQTISSGTATCTVTGYPSWGSYNITAAYSGASNYLKSTSSASTQRVEPPPVGPVGPFRFFSPSSFWNEELAADAPMDPTSAGVVGAFNEEMAAAAEAKKGPTILTTGFSVPIYTVPASQPTVVVTYTGTSASLQAAWDAVPLPADAQPAAGTDKHLVVWQPSTNKLWEFWHLEKTEEGWQAGWGGAIENVSSDSGAYGPEAWPGGGSRYWGASASSLSIAGGLITLEDLERGQINHALAIGIPASRAGVYASPAQRTDGTSSSLLSLPEGAHLRLDPSLDLSTLHLPRLTLMIAEAAQRYGIFVRDTTGNVAFYAQDPIPTGTEPYTGAHGYFEGKSSGQILASFPWSHLQLLTMELHGTS
jgi:hypothetical protein